MSFRPNDVPRGDVVVAQVDTSNVALKWLGPPESGIKMKSSNLRSSSGVTHGELEMPETAPLIYADTGYAETSKPKDEESARGSSPSSRKIARNYFDKRAQAKYVSFQILLNLNHVNTYCVSFEGLQTPRLCIGRSEQARIRFEIRRSDSSFCNGRLHRSGVCCYQGRESDGETSKEACPGITAWKR